MTQIVNGKIIYNELAEKAMGGTELIANRMVNSIDPKLLEGWQIIHSRIRELDPNLKKILVLHDLPGDPESEVLHDPEYRKQFEKIVCVSDWQLQAYNMSCGLPYSESAVIHNGIYPIEDHVKPDPNEQLNIVYHTTPHRGLGILVPVFERLCEYHENIKLHVFSSFEIYGWKERDRPYEELFYRCKNHPNIEYYGTVSNDEIREQLKKMHIFAYPSIWPETSCLAAIEAMSAKCVTVVPNYAALTDTCNRWGTTYQWNEDHTEHARIFMQVLHDTIVTYRQRNMEKFLIHQKGFYDTFYNWDFIKSQWETLLTKLN